MREGIWILPDAPAGRKVDSDGIFLSEQACQAVFDELRGNDDFFWGYTEDCCLPRAHIICHMLHCAGIYCEKIRADNARGTWLRFFGLSFRDEHSGNWVHIAFHMAVVTKLLVAETVEERVIDPALFPCPVSVSSWLARLINRDSIKADGSVDYTAQDKFVTRYAHDVFEKRLFGTNRDKCLSISNRLLDEHRPRSAAMRSCWITAGLDARPLPQAPIGK